MLNELLVGQPGTASTPPNTVLPVRGGQMGDVIVSELHGRYYETNYRKNLYAAYAAAQTLAAAGTAMTGLQLYNPTNSGVNLVISKVNVGVIVTSATMTGVAVGAGIGQPAAPTSQTAATQSSTLQIGASNKSNGLAVNAGTFVNAPIPLFGILHNTAAIGTTGEDDSGLVDLEGSLIITPGNYFAFIATGAASAASAVNLSVIWEEVPI